MSDFPQNPDQGQGQPPGPPPAQWSPQPPPGGPPPGGTPQWGGPQGGYQPQYAPQSQPGNGLAIGALVLGILGFLGSFIVFGAVLGVVGIVLGFIARGKIKRGEATGGGMALTGIILGFLSVLIAILLVVLGAALFSAAESTFSNFTECVEAAGNDQEALDQCGQDYTEDLFGE